MPLIEEHQKKIQYSEQYKNAIGKGLWSWKDNDVSQGDRNVWREINIMSSWQDQYTPYSHRWLTNN